MLSSLACPTAHPACLGGGELALTGQFISVPMKGMCGHNMHLWSRDVALYAHILWKKDKWDPGEPRGETE